MIRALVSGRLYVAPVRRTGQGGKSFVTGKLRVDTGEEHQAWASVIAFGMAGDRLGGLRDGDAVSVAGTVQSTGQLARTNDAASLASRCDPGAVHIRRARSRTSRVLILLLHQEQFHWGRALPCRRRLHRRNLSRCGERHVHHLAYLPIPPL